jgi:hypothetical protein
MRPTTVASPANRWRAAGSLRDRRALRDPADRDADVPRDHGDDLRRVAGQDLDLDSLLEQKRDRLAYVGRSSSARTTRPSGRSPYGGSAPACAGSASLASARAIGDRVRVRARHRLKLDDAQARFRQRARLVDADRVHRG